MRLPAGARYAWPLLLSTALYGQWWQREPLRIIDLTTSVSRIDFREPADVAGRKAALGYNSEHLDVMAMAGGLDDQGFYFISKAAGKVNRDYLRPYLEEAHRRGIRVMIYFNVHWYTMAFGARHPEWQQIREGGAPLDKVYDTGTDFCVNSGWREWCFQVLRDLAAYPIDGIFYDGPVYRPDTCYCQSCREEVRARPALEEEAPGGRVQGVGGFSGDQHRRFSARLAPHPEVHQPGDRVLHEWRRARRQLGHRAG